MPKGDSNKGKVAKFLGHAWENVYQALFFTSSKGLPRIQFPEEARALDSLINISGELCRAVNKKKLESKLKGFNRFQRAFRQLKKIRSKKRDKDCFVNEKNALRQLKILRVKGRQVSLKSGENAQFHAGDIQEISKYVKGKKQPCPSNEIFNKQVRHLETRKFWSKYLVGTKGDHKGDYLVIVKPTILWKHFSMNDVVNALAGSTKWHRTTENRIKGKLPLLCSDETPRFSKINPRTKKILPYKKYSINSKKIYKYLSVITIERKGSSLFFGANGACLANLVQFLEENIPSKEIKRSSIADLAVQ